MALPFSFEEIIKLPFIKKLPLYVKAHDGTFLALYPFLPLKNPIKFVVIFYHGSGLYINNSYQWIGHELSQRTSIAFYGVDIRGHGFSQGRRGDAPSTQAVWADVKQIIETVKSLHPGVPIFVAGHSSGAGLLLNYSYYNNDDDIAGYIFIAPYLGINSGVNKHKPGSPYAFVRNVKTLAFRLYALTKGALGGHMKAVFYNYPQDYLQFDPQIVGFRTVIMGRALDPWEPKKMMEALKKPIALFVADNDEQFDNQKLLAYKQYPKTFVYSKLVPAGHVSILVKTADLIEDAIEHISARSSGG